MEHTGTIGKLLAKAHQIPQDYTLGYIFHAHLLNISFLLDKKSENRCIVEPMKIKFSLLTWSLFALYAGKLVKW